MMPIICTRGDLSSEARLLKLPPAPIASRKSRSSALVELYDRLRSSLKITESYQRVYSPDLSGAFIKMIEVKNLTKTFGTLRAVDNLLFTVENGETLGLLGPNGAGKTTTIQMLLGLTKPTSGEIRCFGLEMEKHRREILSRVNFSSAYISLPSNLTAYENLNVFAKLYGIRNPKRKIIELLELFEIPQVVKQVTGALSSGQMTRLNLCKSFLNDPEILFLDEPTSSLDPDIAEKVRSTLRKIQRERKLTLLYTSHNMREIELMCNRIIFLSHGKIVVQGTPDEILSQSQSNSLEELFISIARNGKEEIF